MSSFAEPYADKRRAKPERFIGLFARFGVEGTDQ
jgi:hypothetical protein